MSGDSPPIRMPGRVSVAAVGATASWALLSLALVSVSVRPVVDTTTLPRFFVNLDALLLPAGAAAVAVAAALAWPRLPALHKTLTVIAALLALSMTLSWVAASPRSLPGLGLGASVLLLLPIALYVAVMATLDAPVALLRRALVLMVLLQLAVGLVQYVALAVAQKAPAGADLVDGTTSHNFWPVFALPASMVLVLVTRDRLRHLWPVAVVVLAVYAEAKAALIVWLPIMALVLGWDAVRSVRRTTHPAAHPGGQDGVDKATRVGLVLAATATVVIGLWWTPSVQGTWSVLQGHTRTLEQFAVAGTGSDAAAPSLRDAATAVSQELTGDPLSAVFGEGPGNTTSHAAEVLAQGAKNGVSLPEPGPLATELLTGADDIKFRDAQSSVLGIWGDLGSLGALLYLLLCAGCAYAMFRHAAPAARWGHPRAWAAPLIVAGVLAGGTLLDWPEQASVVLPVLLAALVLVLPSAPSILGDRSARLVRQEPLVGAGDPLSKVDLGLPAEIGDP
jgi:hypothetical protein